MDDFSELLLAPDAASTLKMLPILSAVLIAIATAFILYLLRCYVCEWRIESRIRRRVQRARARYALLLDLDVSDSQTEDPSSRTTPAPVQ